MLYIIIGYLTVINLVTFISFGLDKTSAQNHWRRTPEKVLWFLSLIGGSAGALLGMKLFRHKTKKLSFQLMMGLILVIQTGVLLLITNTW